MTSLVPENPTSLVEAAAAVRTGDTTATELVSQCLERIETSDGDLQAFVSVQASDALARAAELDASAATGRFAGPLHGIPVAIKDIIDVAGLPTAAGMSVEAVEATTGRSQPAACDAPLVTRLRQAGAVLIGKTVTTAFACFDPPPTRNPHDLERTPGGSSSGSAAAVAAGMCLAAIGSQTGGSITRPAAFCGVAGAKPSLGRVPCAGVVPISEHLDHPGPIARCVADLAVMLDVLISYHPADPTSRNTPAPGLTASLTGPGRPPQLGRLGGIFSDRAGSEAISAVDTAMSAWASAGAETGNSELPASFEEVLDHHRIVLVSGLAANHRDHYPDNADRYPPGLGGLIAEGLDFRMTRYIEARRHQMQLKADILQCFDGYDVLVCPAATGGAPDTSTTGDPSMNAPWSYTGLPTVSFPIGHTDDGLPLSVQLIGRPDGETGLFRAAAWCEANRLAAQTS
ncbi:MAG: amidase [Planctomycetaceae bacterium]|nr:amidase [Planctomycetaceae bacterium]